MFQLMKKVRYGYTCFRVVSSSETFASLLSLLQCVKSFTFTIQESSNPSRLFFRNPVFQVADQETLIHILLHVCLQILNPQPLNMVGTTSIVFDISFAELI